MNIFATLVTWWYGVPSLLVLGAIYFNSSGLICRGRGLMSIFQADI